MNNPKPLSIRELIKSIIPYFFLKNKEQRISVYKQLAKLCIPTYNKYQRYFVFLSPESEQKISAFTDIYHVDSELIKVISAKLKKEKMISELPFLSAITITKFDASNRKKQQQWLGLMLLCCMQLMVLKKHEYAILVALRQIRLTITLPRHQSLLNLLPDLAEVTSLKDLLFELKIIRKELNAPSHQYHRHQKGFSFIFIAIRNAVELSKGIKRSRIVRSQKSSGKKFNLEEDNLKPRIEKKHDGRIEELTSIEEPKNSQEKDESLTIQKTCISRNTFSTKRNQSLSQKAHQHKIITKHLQNHDMSMPCDINQLTTYAVGKFVSACIENIDKVEYFQLFLSMLLGRTVDHLLTRHKQNYLLHENNCTPYYRINHQVPASKIPAELKSIVLEITPYIDLPMPSIFSKWVKVKIPLLDIEALKQVLKNINREHQTNLTLNNISSYLNHFLLNEGVEDIIIALLRNDTHNIKPPLAYATIALESPLHYHRFFIEHLFQLANKKLAFSKTASTTKHIGSGLSIKDNSCHNLFKILAENIKEKHDYCIFHNEFILYVWSILTFCTGHRDVNAPFSKITDFNLKTGTVYISDKECRSALSARTLYLPETAIKQVSFYIEHLKALIATTRFIQPEIMQRCLDALSGKENFLFVFAEHKGKYSAIDITPSILDELFELELILPHNWPRHFFCSIFHAQGVSAELRSLWMGHDTVGNEAFSALAITSLKTNSQLIEEKLNFYEMEALRGWKTR